MKPAYDEMLDASGNVRPSYQSFAAWLDSTPAEVIARKREEADLARSWDLGVNAYVVKPVDTGQFFEAVKTLGKFWAVFNEAPQTT